MMFKKTFILFSLLSVNALASSPSEEFQEKESFFPTHFSLNSLKELISQRETEIGFKIFSISEKDQTTLYSYSPSSVQILTGGSFPERVKKASENVEERTAEYTLSGAYYGENKIAVEGQYDVLKSFLPSEKFGDKTLCLHRLRDLKGDFGTETPHSFRLNGILARLFYVYKVFEQPEDKQASYHAANAHDQLTIGYLAFGSYMKENGLSQELRIQVLDQEAVSLENQFYQDTFFFLISKIHKKLEINEQILESMYEGDGLFKIMEKYNAALEETTHQNM